MKNLSFCVLVCSALSLISKQGCLSDRAEDNNNQRVSVRRVTCFCHCDAYPHAPRQDTCTKCFHAHADSKFNKARSIPAKQPWELLSME